MARAFKPCVSRLEGVFLSSELPRRFPPFMLIRNDVFSGRFQMRTDALLSHLHHRSPPPPADYWSSDRCRDAPAETVVPYVSSHASLMRLPVSLLCYCGLYSFYKPLHCSIRHPRSHDQSSRMATKGIIEFLLNLCNFIIFADKFLILSFYCCFPAAICIQ